MTRFLLTVAVAVVTAEIGFGQDFMPEKAKDFGPSSIGPVLLHYAPIKNPTNEKVRIGAPRIGCGCVSATVMKGELAPGETTYLALSLDTKKIPTNQQNFTKTVSVHVPFIVPNQPLRESRFDVTTVGRTDMAMAPDVLAMGDVKTGSTATAKVTVNLFSPIVWNVTEAKSTGQFVKAEFKKVAGAAGQNGTAYEVTVSLDPKCPAGNWMSDVFLKSATPGLESYRIPVTVNVRPAIAAEPGALKLGEVQMPASGPLAGPRPRIVISGLAPFKIVEVKTGGKQISAKSIFDGAQSRHVVELEVAPEKAGEFAQDIEVVTDSKDTPSVIIPVSATVKK